MQAPITVFTQGAKRESGKKAQFGNIMAAKAVADIVRTTLGPRAMLKMLLDASGGIVLTNDGNAILREIDVSHPAAKSVIELSRTQDEEVGDGTTSVIILAGELLSAAEPFLERNMHATVVIRGLTLAIETALVAVEKLAFDVDVGDRASMLKVLSSCIGTKFTSRFGPLMAELALDAVTTVAHVPEGAPEGSPPEVDTKRYAKVEKLPGGDISDCRVLKGVMFNKDVVSPGRMRRTIRKPRIILLDCPLEYKKGESQTSVELTKEEDWAALLKLEEDYVRRQCEALAALKPDLVVTEKGISDLAVHFLSKNNISAIRRLRKTDNNRIARATGATVVHRVEEIREEDVGTGAGLFEVLKIGDEFYSFVVDCENPRACSIVLRGASKDVLNEVERNLQDAMGVARNVVRNPRLVPGGGAAEAAAANAIASAAATLAGAEAGPFAAVGRALEVIPRTLAQNCGCNVIRTVTELRAAHARAAESGGENGAAACTSGIDGVEGKIVDTKAAGVWEPLEVKIATLKTAAGCATLLLRIDDIVSGMRRRGGGGGGGAPQMDDGDNVDSEQMLPE